MSDAKHEKHLGPNDPEYYAPRELRNRLSGEKPSPTLAPNDGFVHTVYGINLLTTGRLRAALEEGQKGYSLAPANPFVVAFLALFQSLAGHDAEALNYAGAATDLAFLKESQPLPTVYALAALRARRYPEAARLIDAGSLNTQVRYLV